MEEWSEKNFESELLQELPYCYFIVFISYSFLLFVEKILFNSQSLIPMMNDGHGHGHGHGHDEDKKSQDSFSDSEDSDEEEEAMKNVVSAKGKFASFLGVRNSKL